jgi:D-glycero-alpha-D-manno-heptose-7-phosphate kinase
MIITRSPLRISLGGGGTDLPSYYGRHEGFLIAAAIDKYVYITLHDTFDEGFIVKYSKLERVERIEQIHHPLVREAMLLTGVRDHLEIASMSDIPAGTGLGSSGAFTAALLHALHTMSRRIVPKSQLAEEACRIEIEILKEPVGKQDQYISTFGGVTSLAFARDGSVDVQPVNMSSETLASLEDNLTLFFTGYARSASVMLLDQDTRTKATDTVMLRAMHEVKALGVESMKALERGDLRGFAELMHVHWESKRRRSNGMSNDRIDEWYEIGRKNGAIGGKLIGAGGGGFLMFYTEDKTRLRHAMREQGLREVRFRFDFLGTTVVAQS